MNATLRASSSNRRSGRLSGPMAAILIGAVMLAPAAAVCRADDTASAPQDDPAAAGADASVAPGIVLNFQEVPLSAVLEHLSQEAGLVIVGGANVQGRVTVMSLQPLSVAEAVALLNTVLTDKGYAAVRTGRVLKIVTLDEAKTMNVPVHSGRDPRTVEPSDELITQVIPLLYADATQVQQSISPLLPSYAQLAANASSNSLILTDTAASVRRIMEIVRALDSQMATSAEVRVFALANASAQDAADLINGIFQVDQTQSSQGNGAFDPRRFFARMGGPGGPGGEAGQSSETASRAPRVTAVADERTNSVVVSGPSETLAVVAQVLEDLDSNTAKRESVLVYRLKNAAAANVAEVLNNLFEQVESSTTATGARTGNQGGPGGQGRFQQQQQQTTEGADLSGNAYCVADEDSNTLLILTSPSNYPRLRAILAELDRAIPQVVIKVLIAEVTWGKDLDVGVEFSVLDTPDGTATSVFTDFGVAGAVDSTDLPGGLVYRLVRGDLTGALRVLEKLGKLDILSRPQILTSDNQTASITVGQEVPFIQNTRTTDTGDTINTIQYEDIGIILEVTPHINPEGLVIMDVHPQISTTTAETVPISEKVDAPVFAKREAQTKIAIRDGQTIVMGGLMQDRRTKTVRRVPILGSIPLLGALFRRTTEGTEKTELLIFLTPHVVRDAGELKGMADQELGAVQQMKDAVGPRVFDSHLDGLQLGGAQEGQPAAP